jgi:Resolvase, N terminal domain
LEDRFLSSGRSGHGSSFSPLCDSRGRVWSRLGASGSFVKRKAALRIVAAFSPQLLRRLRPGDIVIVSALDRLTRGGPFKMLSVLAEITSRGAAYKSLAEPRGGLLGRSAGRTGRVHRAKTRGDILMRTAAGRERARLRGVNLAQLKLSPEQQSQALRRRQS